MKKIKKQEILADLRQQEVQKEYDKLFVVKEGLVSKLEFKHVHYLKKAEILHSTIDNEVE